MVKSYNANFENIWIDINILEKNYFQKRLYLAKLLKKEKIQKSKIADFHFWVTLPVFFAQKNKFKKLILIKSLNSFSLFHNNEKEINDFKTCEAWINLVIDNKIDKLTKFIENYQINDPNSKSLFSKPSFYERQKKYIRGFHKKNIDQYYFEFISLLNLRDNQKEANKFRIFKNINNINIKIENNQEEFIKKIDSKKIYEEYINFSKLEKDLEFQKQKGQYDQLKSEYKNIKAFSSIFVDSEGKVALWNKFKDSEGNPGVSKLTVMDVLKIITKETSNGQYSAGISSRHISKQLSLSIRSVWRSLKILKDNNIISFVSGKEKGQANIYNILVSKINSTKQFIKFPNKFKDRIKFRSIHFALLVYSCWVTKQGGRKTNISFQNLSEKIGFNKITISKAFKDLEQMKLILLKKIWKPDETFFYEISFNLKEYIDKNKIKNNSFLKDYLNITNSENKVNESWMDIDL